MMGIPGGVHALGRHYSYYTAAAAEYSRQANWMLPPLIGWSLKFLHETVYLAAAGKTINLN